VFTFSMLTVVVCGGIGGALGSALVGRKEGHGKARLEQAVTVDIGVAT
jgi:hypothetical protein